MLRSVVAGRAWRGVAHLKDRVDVDIVGVGDTKESHIVAFTFFQAKYGTFHRGVLALVCDGETSRQRLQGRYKGL